MDSLCNVVCSTLQIPARSELVPEVLNVFINHLGKWVSSESQKFDDDSKIARTSSDQKNCINEPYETKWLSNQVAGKIQVKFNIEKWRTVHTEQLQLHILV